MAEPAQPIQQNINRVVPLGTNLRDTANNEEESKEQKKAEEGPVTSQNVEARLQQRNIDALDFIRFTPIAAGKPAIGQLFQAKKVTGTEIKLSEAAKQFCLQIREDKEVDAPDGSGQQVVQKAGLFHQYANTTHNIIENDLRQARELQKSSDFKKALTQDTAAAAKVFASIERQYANTSNELKALHKKQLNDLKKLFYPPNAGGAPTLIELKRGDGTEIASPAEIQAFYANARTYLEQKQKEESQLLADLYNHRVEKFSDRYGRAFQIETEKAHHNSFHKKKASSNPLPDYFCDFEDAWYKHRAENWEDTSNKANKVMSYTTHLDKTRSATEQHTLQIDKDGNVGSVSCSVVFPGNATPKEQLAILKKTCGRMVAMGKGNSHDNPFDLSKISLPPKYKAELVKEILIYNPQAVIYGPDVPESWRKDAALKNQKLQQSGKIMGEHSLKLKGQPLPQQPSFALDTVPSPQNTSGTAVRPLNTPANRTGVMPYPPNPLHQANPRRRIAVPIPPNPAPVPPVGGGPRNGP